jgi:hypothetical protein
VHIVARGAPAKFSGSSSSYPKPGQRRAAPLKTRTRALISPLNAARRPLLLLLEHHLHTSQLWLMSPARTDEFNIQLAYCAQNRTCNSANRRWIREN